MQPTGQAVPSLLMIAIAHCLHSQSITTINRNIGSEHLPLVVELSLNPDAQRVAKAS